MNNKGTNRLVAILNIVLIVSIYILSFSSNYLTSSMMTGENGGKCIYNSFIIDILVHNIQLIFTLIMGGVGIINIICAIQNKQDKKLCFWQSTFGIYEIWQSISVSGALKDIKLMNLGAVIVFAIIPAIFAIKNLIFIKKNKPKRIQVISYIIAIVWSVLFITVIIGEYDEILGIVNLLWSVIYIVMQLIYIYHQDKNVVESNKRKIINIVLYYVLQSILTIGFLLMIISALIITKVNDDRWKKELSDLYTNIATLPGATKKELYIPVEKNYKYGFIDQNGQEKIPCEYDRVTYFNEIELNNKMYYVAFAKKDDKFYIISKNNDNIALNGILEKGMNTVYDYWGKSLTEQFNEDDNYRNSYVESFDFIFNVLTHAELELNKQVAKYNNDDNQIELEEKNSKYIYKNKNYTMTIEPIDEEETEDEDLYEYYDGEDEELYEYYDEEDEELYEYDDEEDDLYYLPPLKSINYNVTITKANGETESSIVKLPEFNAESATLGTFADGNIEFKSTDYSKDGWYDEDGNQHMISTSDNDGYEYNIEDIRNNKIIIHITNDEKGSRNYIIINESGEKLLETKSLVIYDDFYLIKNENNKMILIDENLKTISNEYDRISADMQSDGFAYYSSYFEN